MDQVFGESGATWWVRKGKTSSNILFLSMIFKCILKLVHLTPNIEYMFKLPFDSFPSSSIKYLDKKIFQLKRREKRCKIVSIYS